MVSFFGLDEIFGEWSQHHFVADLNQKLVAEERTKPGQTTARC